MTGCNTTPPPPPASEAEQSAGVKRFVTCLYRNVAKVDDRVSDAATIATALLGGPCAAANAAAQEAYTRGMSERERIVFESQATAPFQAALDVVINHRKGKKAPPRMPAEAPSRRMQ